MSEQTGSVLAEENGSARSLILNRPKSINAIDHEMVTEMAKLLDGWATDDAVAAVVLYGAGERGLCAGGDIVAIHRDAAALSGNPDATDLDAENSPSAKFWFDEYRLNAGISRFPKKYVAIMDGIVMGGGVGVSAHGNTRVVTDRTRLAMPEVGIGFVPDVGGTHLLSRVPDGLGLYAGLTAAHLSGADAIAMGLADHYVPSESLPEFIEAIGSSGLDAALGRFATEAPESKLAAQRGWISEAFAAETVSEIIERCRAVGTEEATKTADTIAAKSPTALAVTLRSLREAAGDATLEDTLVREYRVSLRCLLHPDMAEGIRAQVIDKDRNPSWAEFSEASVEKFFAPLPHDLTFDA
ncbi:3-hydroxyisobutyryl-CoA hydrolase [Gordonia paraffinivorans]|uniref:enoyl-CoA hydratase/isomerase family protein n=1 Tax=Gordonia paraffinivorans TaxID=175628 RepID=UPI000D61AA43|nr:enoyl-CoA hydratase/isomerase family protein [Gordonia paraffinivorans]PWD42800.1 3-hydroxyisobutyryl-CoA hydrolase [Gordonia paraffinivorans]